MNPLQRSLIEKLGHDHGFEHVLPGAPHTVALASARHGARADVSLLSGAEGLFMIVEAATPALLPEMRRTFPNLSFAAGFAASSEAELAALLRRAASLARALPSQAARDFESEVSRRLSELPKGLGDTEVERLVRQRVGQQKFRSAMLDYWGGACAVTGLAMPESPRVRMLVAPIELDSMESKFMDGGGRLWSLWAKARAVGNACVVHGKRAGARSASSTNPQPWPAPKAPAPAALCFNAGAMVREEVGSIRTSIQGPGGSAHAAAGERAAGGGVA